MLDKRTGPPLLNLIRSLLTSFGKPPFYVFLFFIYILIAIVSQFSKLLIQLIKGITELIRQTSIISKQVVLFIKNVLTEIFNLLVKSFLFIKSKPIKNIIRKLNNTKIPGSSSFSIKKSVLIASFIFSFTFLVLFILIRTINALPDPGQLATRDQIVSTKIYDRNGNLLYKIYKNENRTLVKLEDLPLSLIKATIAIEDKDFYKHSGYSYKGIFRALYQIISGNKLEGGSTLTQQLVKNALLSKERSLNRKIKELLLSIIVEAKFSKNQILTMYLNEVSYGGSTYGIEEASQTYFGKSAKELSLAEAALLAGVSAAPTRYSPFGTQPELAKLRQHEVLRRMQEDGYISPQTAQKAKVDKLEFISPKTDIKAPHFVMYVKQLLVDKFGEQMLEQGGLEVTTSLDLDVQNLAQLTLTQEVDKLAKLNITNGAALVTKPATGEILAMVGSKDFFDLKHDGQVNVTLSPRQPGSAIKPVNYAVALENGSTAATIISDTPITYTIPDQPPYSPKNYDNTYHGNVTLRLALANSYNVPAVKTLASFGVEKMLAKGKSMGISTWEDQSKYGLSLTLGGGEVTMTDLATVYGSLANGGYRVNLTPILQVTDYRGKLLYKYSCGDPNTKVMLSSQQPEIATCGPVKVVEPGIAFILSDILSDNQARSKAFGSYSLLNIPNQKVAVKTGTTQNLRDNWTIGYTQDLLVATWVGNNDNSPMSYVASGITGATPVWYTIMNSLLSNQSPHEFKVPQNIEKIEICPYTGTLACSGCLKQIEYFVSGTAPTSTCSLTVDQHQSGPEPENSVPNTRPVFLIHKPHSPKQSQKLNRKN